MALQYVADANLQTVTLGSNYTLGDTSMVLTTGQGARLPSSGDFWIMTPDTAPPNRIIWKVTARSSDTLTVVYDNSYGADANLTAGTRLMWSLTAEALTQLKTDIAGTYGTFANLPAATAGVVRYDFTDSPYSHAISDGSAWHYFIPGFGEATLPPLTGWSWVNQGSASVSTTIGGLLLASSAGTSGVATYYRTAPATPYTVTFIFSVNLVSINFTEAGILFRQSSTQQLLFGAARNDSIVTAGFWNTATSFNSGVGSSAVASTQSGVLLALRLSNSGTTKTIGFRPNLLVGPWRTIDSRSSTDLLTPDQFGIGLQIASGSSAAMNLVHMDIS
jgi:hypothetical protein